MTAQQLITLINDTKDETSNLEDFFKRYYENTEFHKTKIDINANIESILNIDDSKKTNFGNKLSILQNICNEKMSAAKEFGAKDYIENVEKFKNVICTLIELYHNAMKYEADRLAKEKSIDSVEQGDISRTTKGVSNLKSDINRANKEINSINKKLKEQKEMFDSKVFQVLLNTVSLLGIFVAIAFTGFGTITIFSNIDIETWMQSAETFVKNTFVLLSTSFLAYNLLLLLVYFIYKLSRPLNPNASDSPDKKDDSSHNIKLWPFITIDVLLFLLVVALFIWCAFFMK